MTGGEWQHWLDGIDRLPAETLSGIVDAIARELRARDILKTHEVTAVRGIFKAAFEGKKRREAIREAASKGETQAVSGEASVNQSQSGHDSPA